jgi:cytochrome b
VNEPTTTEGSEPGRRSSPGADGSYRIWDLPVRLVHWAIVVLVALQWATAKYDVLSMDWHFRFGYVLLGLVAFRVLWGFAGSDSARFTRFVRGPAAVWRYLRAGARERFGTHNPLGGWSVVLLLAVLLVQATTGLFANDDDIVVGPLADVVDARVSENLTELHEDGQNVILALVGLHVLAVLWHFVTRKEDLIVAMFTGRKRLAADPAYRFAGIGRALALGAAVALAVWALVTYGPAVL